MLKNAKIQKEMKLHPVIGVFGNQIANGVQKKKIKLVNMFNCFLGLQEYPNFSSKSFKSFSLVG